MHIYIYVCVHICMTVSHRDKGPTVKVPKIRLLSVLVCILAPAFMEPPYTAALRAIFGVQS